MAAAAVACAALVSPAFGQVAEDAKQVLNESAKAIKDAKGMTFKAKTYGTSILKDIIDLDGSVKIWRPEGATTAVWLVEGRSKDPGKPDRKLVVTSDGSTVKWMDYAQNKLFIRPNTDSLALESTNMCKELLLPDLLNPSFQDELGKPILTKTGIAPVAGEVCDIVEAMPADKSRNRTWSISVKDRLPRQLELGTGTNVDKISKITEITALEVKPLSSKDFDLETRIKDMPNWVVDKIEAAKPAAMPNETPAAKVELGLKPGTPAPKFTAKDSSGADIAFASGTPMVMEFWGPMFKQSTMHAAEMRNLSEQFKGKAKFVGFACRADEKTASDWWSKSGPGYPLVAKGDAIASDFKVMGFPSYVVIDSTGNVAAFYQDFPGADTLKQAIEKASK